MRSTRHVLLALVATGLCVSPALGQSAGQTAAATQTTSETGNWDRLRSVKAGTRLVVVRRASRDLKARMEAFGPETLQVRGSDADVVSLRRDQVLAVYQDHRFTTKEWLGIGVLAGAGAGLAIGAIGDSRCDDCELRGLGVRVGPVVGAINGLVGGLFLGGVANRNPPRLIYRAPF